MKNLDQMTPGEIVRSLDAYIIGQNSAKRQIAIAIRNRTRRKLLSEQMRHEVSPKNIMMIGPTGVGKTEIARRIAKLAQAPFIKVEATKYTEVGYVGRDCESMVRDLMGAAVSMVKSEMAKANENKVKDAVNERLLDLLLPGLENGTDVVDTKVVDARADFKDKLEKGFFDNREVSITVNPASSGVEIGVLGSGNNMDDIQQAMNSLGSIFQKPKTRKVTVKRAREILTEEETEKSVDKDKAIEEAKVRTEEMGIIFIDEIDKIASNGNRSNTDVSREGVQRDILPIVEGTQVSTKWGVIDTTNILFIGAGAFSLSKPSDLIPELQGRFPIRVELEDLTADDFYRILTEPENAITKQYRELLGTEGLNLVFTDDGIREVSRIAHEVNQSTENIGARRLYTVMEKLLEDVSFTADTLSGQNVTIDTEYVKNKLSGIAENQDLSKYIL
jgi:ATP-dependent protease HslVU, ATPase subunit